MQLQENAPLTGTEGGSAGDLFANLPVLKKNEQLINDLPALPEERDQHSRVAPLFCKMVGGS